MCELAQMLCNDTRAGSPSCLSRFLSMLATQEAQVIPVTQMKHFWTFISLPAQVDCDPVPLLTPALLDDCKSERSEGPELTGLDLS